jgi:3-deoxy-manno-octulosonate cytidylyltransferase (CMP-KDO synthetase)
VAALSAHETAEVATPVLRCTGRALSGFLEDRRAGRVGATTAVFGIERKALYFSKEVIPYTTHGYPDAEMTPVFHHVGVYAYRPSALAAYPRWAPGPLERLEGLEQLRFLERDRPVLCVEVEARGRQFWELNNPEDVDRIEAMLAEMGVE